MEEKIKEYIAKNPFLSNRKLAELILERENFPYTYGTMRQIIGRLRSKIAEKYEDFETETTLELPESWYHEEKDYEVPSRENRIAVINDIHIPFHSVENLKIALDYIYNWQPTTIILNGDILDCYAISSFARNPKYRDFNKEIELGRKFLEYIRKRFENVHIIYKFGNHEQRLQFYLWRKAEELSEVQEIQLENLLRLYQYDITFVNENQLIKIDKLYVLHGHEIPSGGGLVNIARNIRLKSAENVLCGHFHRSQEDIVTTISGKAIGGWAVGALCGLRPPYRPVSFWNAGFALIERTDDRTFSIENKKIILGKVL
jgi:predicted phosphodiesterase